VKRLAGALYATLGLILVLAAAAADSLYLTPWIVIPRGRRERWTIHGARMFAWFCLHPVLWVRTELIGTEHLPKGRGYLVISNHRSWADVALLMLHTWSNGISKREVAWIPFFGLNGWLAGAIFFDRKSRMARARVVDEALMLLRSGHRLHVFPEGTRTRTGRLGEKIYLRLVQSAVEAGIPVVPACVWGTESAVPATGFQAWPGRRVGLELAPPPARARDEDAEAYARRCWDVVVGMARRHGADQAF
jgi:1-acyl-sn-glycerol-3-phosphate acyltransferase